VKYLWFVFLGSVLNPRPECACELEFKLTSLARSRFTGRTRFQSHCFEKGNNLFTVRKKESILALKKSSAAVDRPSTSGKSHEESRKSHTNHHGLEYKNNLISKSLSSGLCMTRDSRRKPGAWGLARVQRSVWLSAMRRLGWFRSKSQGLLLLRVCFRRSVGWRTGRFFNARWREAWYVMKKIWRHRFVNKVIFII
jgi:hypothetical protein